MTTTQGEHAQTEALRPIQRFNNIAGLMNPESRGLYVRYEDHAAQVAALTAAPADNEVLPLLIRDIANDLGKTAIEVMQVLRDTGHGNTSVNTAVTRSMAASLRKHFETATAQPAAPQGVAYAGLPAGSAWCGAADVRDFGKGPGESALMFAPTRTQNIPLFTADQMHYFADATHALRASNGQAPAGAVVPDDRVPEAWTNLLAYVLQDDMHNRLTPRVIDIAYTAFMQAKKANDEDGGASDWFNDTRPMVRGLIEKLKKDLIKELAVAPPTPTAQAAPAAGNWIDADDVKRLVRQLDVALNGNAGAAIQASLCDIVAQVEHESAKRGRPVLAAAPTPAAQADSVQGLQPVHDAVTIELLNERVAYLEGKLKEADSVLEDATRLEQIVEAIRDYHHALDMRKHGGLAESVAFNSICQTMGMTWSQGEEAARRAARKQGGKHD